MDFVISCPKLPRAGETIKGTEYAQFPGGKGANQAVAAAKLGGRVTILGAVGGDQFGSALLANMRSAGITVDSIDRRKRASTGIAFIIVDRKGQNLIPFVPGANGELDRSHVDSAVDVIKAADVFLVQLECPAGTVEHAIRTASDSGVPVILNPAPAISVSEDILKRCTVVMPNESEAEVLTGIRVKDETGVKRAAKALLGKGCKAVIITLGEKGAYLLTRDGEGMLIRAPRVNSIDSVAAGDVFAGAFAVSYCNRKDYVQATEYANYAAALSTTQKGAQPSVPAMEEVSRLIDEVRPQYL